MRNTVQTGPGWKSGGEKTNARSFVSAYFNLIPKTRNTPNTLDYPNISLLSTVKDCQSRNWVSRAKIGSTSAGRKNTTFNFLSMRCSWLVHHPFFRAKRLFSNANTFGTLKWTYSKSRASWLSFCISRRSSSLRSSSSSPRLRPVRSGQYYFWWTNWYNIPL